MKRLTFFSIFFISISFYLFSQSRINGPVIKDFGGTFAIENPDFQTDPEKVYKVVFDIHDSPENPAWLNPQLNTLARFINMHVHAGVPLENLKVACVFHNKATKDVMDNASYKGKVWRRQSQHPAHGGAGRGRSRYLLLWTIHVCTWTRARQTCETGKGRSISHDDHFVPGTRRLSAD